MLNSTVISIYRWASAHAHRRQPSIYENKLNIPAQNNPFPTKPVLHAHTNEPKVLAQLPWTLQGLAKHSFISKIQRFCRLYVL